MKNSLYLFVVQIMTAIGVLVGISYLVTGLFLKDTKAQSYLALDSGVKKMARSADILMDSLIAKNNLTFDPTYGKLIDKVLENLKYSEGEKLLMVGSSQLRAIQGEELYNSYEKLVSRRIKDGTEYNVYNLSIGGMKTTEKLIVAEKGVQVLQPTRILISATPWDCLIDEVRPEIKNIEDKKYKPITRKAEILGGNHGSVIYGFPKNVNNTVTANVDKIVGDNIEVYNKRAAIKQWLDTEIKEVLTSKEDKGEVSNKAPDYWRTLNQELDNTLGWDHTVARTGTSSLKIRNIGSTSAKWLGDDIVLEKPTETFEFSGWSKAQNAEGAKLYTLDFLVFFDDGTYQWYLKGLKFNLGTHDWEKASAGARFDKKVVKIKPHALFYGGTGTVWFDDFRAIPIYNGKKGDNILPNAGFEIELKERANVSYTYSDTEWEQIKKNMFRIIDYLSAQKSKERNIFLMTPFWNHKEKTAYPQKSKYKDLLIAVKSYCNNKNVDFVDASYILSAENFGIYTKGSVRDKIDVLHFNADAHEKLAKYIITELNL